MSCITCKISKQGNAIPTCQADSACEKGNVAEPNPSVNASADFSRACQQTNAINRVFQKRENISICIDTLLDQKRVMESTWSFHVEEVLYFEVTVTVPMAIFKCDFSELLALVNGILVYIQWGTLRIKKQLIFNRVENAICRGENSH